jgi:hypothetical protein
MQINYKKGLKLVTLLLTSLLIAFASAETFSELYMRSTPIEIEGAGVYFSNGANTTGIGTIFYGGTEVNFTGMKVQKSQKKIYSEAVNITNNAGVAKNITLVVTSTSGNLTAFSNVTISIIDETGALKGSQIYLAPSGSNTTTTGKIVMGDTKVWAVKWEISAIPSADTGTTLGVFTKLTVED